MKVFVSWSGGKESALGCYRAMKREKHEVAYLLNMVSEDGRYSCSHGINSELLRAQAKAMGLPLVQKKTTPKTYAEEFKKAVREFRKEGVEAGVFGDIEFQPHRDWVENVSREAGLRALLPLWGEKREELLGEFLHAGFETTVIAVRQDVLGPEWLGRTIDREFVKDLGKLGTVDLCGEAGEYHTLVTSGPIFKKRITILKSRKIQKDKHWFLKVLSYEIGGRR